jgi:hypothetical protein
MPAKSSDDLVRLIIKISHYIHNYKDNLLQHSTITEILDNRTNNLKSLLNYSSESAGLA